MKKLLLIFFIAFILMFSGCEEDPLTGKTTLALISNRELFQIAGDSYGDFKDKNDNNIVSPYNPKYASNSKMMEHYHMIQRVGKRIQEAAIKLVTEQGNPKYFDDYIWEYTLLEENEVNAWAMPAGLITFYTGILPILSNEAGAAVVMGHEVAHALHNHGQQRMSLSLLVELGAIGLSLATMGTSPEAQQVILSVYGVGTLFGKQLPFSRNNEHQADETGLLLMAIAGYDPYEGARLWERMQKAGAGGTPEFMSTHPSPPNRIRNLTSYAPTAASEANRIGKVSGPVGNWTFN